MKPARSVIWLSGLIAVLSAISSGIGLFWHDTGHSFVVTTMRGEIVEMYGQGVYRYESLRNGVGFKGVDLFMLVVGMPLLLVATRLYQRGSLRGGLLLVGTLAYLVYNSAHLVFSYAYNHLFIVYIMLFSASLFACVLSFRSIDAQELAARFTPHLLRRSIATFLFAVGVSLIIVWIGLDLLPALLQGHAPRLMGATTLVTHAIDVGVIAPLAFGSGLLLLRRAPLGYLLAATLLVLSSVLGAGVLALSAAQALAGVLTTVETVVFVVPFVVLTAVGIVLTVGMFRAISGSAPEQTAAMQTAPV
ncbi:MAG TPA: hypothetical protein VGD58_02905 [Herpetosiphonaceae bacterium]